MAITVVKINCMSLAIFWNFDFMAIQCFITFNIWLCLLTLRNVQYNKWQSLANVAHIFELMSKFHKLMGTFHTIITLLSCSVSTPPNTEEHDDWLNYRVVLRFTVWRFVRLSEPQRSVQQKLMDCNKNTKGLENTVDFHPRVCRLHLKTASCK